MYFTDPTLRNAHEHLNDLRQEAHAARNTPRLRTSLALTLHALARKLEPSLNPREQLA